FAQETPYELITAIIPNILVKGSDYNENTIVGADVVKKHGGKVTTIDFVSGYSSTNYFKKM
ncbi:MAG TPA: D-glycero-beta-D-manno-heptose 1-phosphate adenylyltransferase, partial [Bacteroidales bacterium]|nr:D-glycero-beta-D-manno-heptose 1-phosphate adenylyltransferase [Bacteroidales bacterium]